MRIGGRGVWSGRGRITASRKLNSSMRVVTRSPVHSRHRRSRFRSNRRPRCPKGTPTASNSRAYQPAATPRIRRPREMTSSVPSVFATTIGLRSGSTSTPVPSRIRLVRTAMAVKVTRASRIGKEGSTPRMTWSQAQSDSKPSSSARTSYRISPSMSGVSVGPTKFLSARPQAVMPARSSCEEPPLRVDGAQERELLLCWRLRRLDALRHQDLEARLGGDGVPRDARVEGVQPEALVVGIEAKQAERRHHAGHASEEEPGLPAAVAAGQVPGARDEVDRLHETAPLVDGEHDGLFAERDDVVGATRTRQPHRGLPVLAAERARVEVAVAVDLGAADEAVVEEAALGEEEGVRDAGQHRRVPSGPHLVRRDREPPRLDPGPDDAALDHQREPRGMAPLGEDRGQEGDADAGEDGRIVPELAGAHDGEELGRRVPRRRHPASSRARPAWRARRSLPNRSRYSACVAGPYTNRSR